MAEPEQPQLYLITPPQISLSSFPDQLARVLDATPVACMRLALSTGDEDHLMRAGDVLRELAHARDVPLVIDAHVQLAERLGLDGVHLNDAARSVRTARKVLGPDAIVGTFCGNSRHDGMTAAEAGADYVAFGPVTETTLGTGHIAPHDLFQWWSEMIEVPVVAEGALDAQVIAALAPVTDFFCVGEEIWNTDDPADTLLTLTAALR